MKCFNDKITPLLNTEITKDEGSQDIMVGMYVVFHNKSVAGYLPRSL